MKNSAVSCTDVQEYDSKHERKKIGSQEQHNVFLHFAILILLLDSVAGSVLWLATQFKWSAKGCWPHGAREN